jgi:hypothetical protein
VSENTGDPVAEQARALLAWAKPEIHNGVFLSGALEQLKKRVARLLYALAQRTSDGARSDGGAAARLWAFFSPVDPLKQPVGFREFIESFRARDPGEAILRDLWRLDYLSTAPAPGVDPVAWEAARERDFAGPPGVAEFLQCLRGIAAQLELETDPDGGPEEQAAPGARADVNDDSYLSSAKLAEVFNVAADALRTRLNRWRAVNHSGWIENSDPGPREAKYLYRVGAVRPIIDAVRATSKTTSERPAKKKEPR